MKSNALTKEFWRNKKLVEFFAAHPERARARCAYGQTERRGAKRSVPLTGVLGLAEWVRAVNK